MVVVNDRGILLSNLLPWHLPMYVVVLEKSHDCVPVVLSCVYVFVCMCLCVFVHVVCVGT